MCFFSIPVSGTVSPDSENKLDKQASSLLTDKRISGPAELSALTVEGNPDRRSGKRKALRRGKNGTASNGSFEGDEICCANLPERLAGAGLLCKVGGLIGE